MTLTDIAIVLLVGFAIGWAARSYYMPTPKGPRQYNVSVSPHSTMRLHYLGKLSEAQFRSLCTRIANGEPFRLERFTKPPARIMSRPQWVGVRDELVNRGMAERLPDRTVNIRPTGYAFFKWGARRYERANDNTNR